jgi:hypothetical protein
LSVVRLVALVLVLLGMAAPGLAQSIDRKSLVERHNITLTAIDPHAPVMLGNGTLGFTADITGLQTFPEHYSPLAPLLTMAQWGWHSFPNPKGFTEQDGLVMVPVPGRGDQPYPWIRDWKELDTRPALAWLRENPHRFSLGRLALRLRHANSRVAVFSDLTQTRQHLDLWLGTLTSRFVFDGMPVTIITRVLPQRDAIAVDIRSPLVRNGRLGVDLRFPGVSARLNPDPSDWTQGERHRSVILAQSLGRLSLRRELDGTHYWSTVSAPGAKIARASAHGFAISRPGSDHLTLIASFDAREQPPVPMPMTSAAAAVARHWTRFWMSGAAIDFSGSRDPRAHELERRVVLSQYLAAINQTGPVPPQEEGLFSNSWNGKFHLEVQPLHLGHFAAWGRASLMEQTLAWYLSALPSAQALARRHGMPGAWWTKMAGPEGRNSPSTINPFIMWQQPSPIYLAELARRAGNSRTALARYGDLVEQTGALLAAWPQRDASDGRFHLGPPIIPVQENHPPLTTRDPGFELAFFHWGLETAQQWRTLRGLPRREEWDMVLSTLADPPLEGDLLAPVASAPDFWARAKHPDCSRHAVAEACQNRDHPSFLLSYGLIRSDRVSAAAARSSLQAVKDHWDLRQTWGWDYPVLAMTATRLGDPEAAIDWLFADYRNNRWGITGMTPRVHLDAHAADLFARSPGTAGEDGPGYRRAAETYFPSNGSLLLAVALMAQADQGRPLFPSGWRVRAEGFVPLP